MIDQNDWQRLRNPQDAKELISVYQLWKSQLVFTLAELQNYQDMPIPIPESSVFSKITVDTAAAKRGKLTSIADEHKA